MALVKLSATERRRVSAFFTCLVLAAFAWLFTTLSSPYNFTVKAVLNYRNVPQKRAFHSLQSDTVDVVTQGNGWQMMFNRIKNDKRAITVDLRSLETRDYVVLSAQLQRINDAQDSSERIVAIDPDTLYFDFSNRSTKRVPVKLLSGVRYQHQFAQSGDISLNPGYVTLNGPSNLLDKIKSWDTDSLKIDSANETIKTRVNLKPVTEGNVSIYPKSVYVHIPVDEFTEKTLQIPVTLLNHGYYNVKIFPQKVNVTFMTSLNKYKETDEDLFEVSADLNLWRNNNYSSLPVKLTRSPLYSRIVRIDPQNIDFIIKK